MKTSLFVLAATAATASAIDMRYFFGSRCPGCREFGSGDYTKLYADFGSDSSIDWQLTPAVRSPSGPCIEENDCSWETVTLCGFNQTETADRVSFLACLDDSDAESAKQGAKACASKSNIDDAKLLECANGQQGVDLLTTASKAWNKQFPDRATVPHTFVGTKDVQPSYDTIKTALCSAGSTASVCKNKASYCVA